MKYLMLNKNYKCTEGYNECINYIVNGQNGYKLKLFDN